MIAVLRLDPRVFVHHIPLSIYAGFLPWWFACCSRASLDPFHVLLFLHPSILPSALDARGAPSAPVLRAVLVSFILATLQQGEILSCMGSIATRLFKSRAVVGEIFRDRLTSLEFHIS